MVERSITSGWQTIGHERVVSKLTNHILSGQLRHSYLFSGPPSIGKNTLANDFAKAICCIDNLGDPCGLCRPCKLISASKHPDVVEISPRVSGKAIVQKKLSVDEIRNTIYRFTLNPVELNRRIAIINNFETAGRMASDALLKTLEEPPGDSIFIISTNQESSVADTILSRCVVFNLSPTPFPVVEQALIKVWGATEQEAHFLARVSGGRIGWAIKLLTDNKALERRSQKLVEMFELLSFSRVRRFAYVDDLRKDRQQAVTTLALWEGLWRDVMITSVDTNGTEISNIDYKTEIHEVASQIDITNIVKTLSAIHKTQRALHKNANARLALEVLMLQIPLVRHVN